MFIIRVFLSAAVLAMSVAATQVLPAAAAQSEPEGVFNFASSQLSKPFRLGSKGLERYDCSGFIYRTYLETGLLDRIGGQYRRARGYYEWFRARGLTTVDPRPGDLVVWAYPGKPVSHMGIFTGWNEKGQPMAISALVNPYGVTLHRVQSISIPLKAYLSVNLNR